MAEPLTISFLDEAHTLQPGESLTFGRQGDLVVDDANPYLHRILGRLDHRDGIWWLTNRGTRMELELVTASGTVIRLPAVEDPASAAPVAVPGGDSTLRFEAGGARYLLELSTPQRHDDAAPPAPVEGVETLGAGRIELTDEERALVLALAEPRLRDRTAGPETLPTNKALARRLGWSVTKYNRKLDYLCVRLAKHGVRGLTGGAGVKADHRRWRVVEHAVGTRLVTVEDLDGPDADAVRAT